MLSTQHSQLSTGALNNKDYTPITNTPTSDIPDYFTISEGYSIIPVGHNSATYHIANEVNYDCYILAGIEENELFSKLIMMNMGVKKGIAFDENVNKISQYFPSNIQVINKGIGYRNTPRSENLSNLGEDKDIFLKMNVHGEEYLWILSLSSENIKKFKQLVIVFHDINNNPTQQRALNKIKCFQKLKETHDIVHIKPSKDDIVITYFRKDSRGNSEIASSNIKDHMDKKESINSFYLHENSNSSQDDNSSTKPDILEIEIKNVTHNVFKKLHNLTHNPSIKHQIDLLSNELINNITQVINSNKTYDHSVTKDTVIEPMVDSKTETSVNDIIPKNTEPNELTTNESQTQDKPLTKSAIKRAAKKAAKKSVKIDDLTVDETPADSSYDVSQDEHIERTSDTNQNAENI